MSDLRYVIDHLRLNYSGPFDAHELYRLATAFWREKGFDLNPYKEFEHHTQDGTQIEWVLKPWKQVSHDQRNLVKMRFLIHNYKKVDAVLQNKKIKIGNGRVEVYLDGYIDLDQWNVWDANPFFQFVRAIYNNFIFRIYTERFEQRFNYDMHHFYDMLEKFFGVYRHYRVISKTAPFATQASFEPGH